MPMMGHGAGRGLPTEKVDMKKNLTRLANSFRPYFLATAVSLVCIAVSVVISIIAPQWLSKLTDEVTGGAAKMSIDMSKIAHFATVLIVFYVTNAIMHYISGFIMNTVTQRYSKDLRSELDQKINRMKLLYFDSHPFGDTLSIVTNDVDQIGMSMQQSVTMLFQSVMMLVGVLIAMFINSWQMALAVLSSIPLALIVLAFVMKIAMPLFKRRQTEIGEVNGIIEENFTGHLVIRAFNAEKSKRETFEEANHRLYKTMFKAQTVGGIMMPLMSFLSYFAYAAVLLVGGLLLANGTGGTTFGTITAFMVYVNLFQTPLSQIAQSMNALQMAAASASRVFDFIETEEQEDESDKPSLLKTEDVCGEVEFRNVRFGYREGRIIIPDFSAKIKPGMKVAIVGPTGAGKTTIVNLLMRFYETLDGDILIDGKSIREMPRTELRNIFGMVLQDTWMFEGTLRENIVFNKTDVSDERLREIIKETNLEYYVSTLAHGVDTMLDGEGAMSAGQKQLVTIARAMAENAPLLILDEATSNVDTRTEIEIQEAMDRLTHGRTSFVIAHRLSTIKNADMILVMRDGNIVEQGCHDELISLDGFYASLYNSQFALNG
ncbi:MAG: ABC transporter ATP-binding protein/permease [Clostridia bacterium]|nr:ABC transporter ATP-binding protein/permease [Clostridia bacterium]